MKIEIGSTIKHFVFLEKLGEGGMGSVYKCFDKKLKRHVAIKILISNETENLKRFQTEAMVLAQFNHPNISIVHDIDHEDNSLFIVMEYLEGRDLKKTLSEKSKMTVREYLTHFKEIANAFEFIHGKGIIHRDIKLSNLFLTNEGKLKVIDFGISKWKEAVDQQITKANSLVGSLTYIPPEVLEGNKPTPASDIYSLGLSFANGLTNSNLIDGDSVTEIIHMIKFGELELPEIYFENCPEEFLSFIELTVAKDPRDRFSNMQEAENYLQGLLENLNKSFLDQDLSSLLSKRKKFPARSKAVKERISNIPKSPRTSIAPKTSKKGLINKVAMIFLLLGVLGVLRKMRIKSIEQRKTQIVKVDQKSIHQLETDPKEVQFKNLRKFDPLRKYFDNEKYPKVTKSIEELDVFYTLSKKHNIKSQYIDDQIYRDIEKLFEKEKIVWAYTTIKKTSEHLVGELDKKGIAHPKFESPRRKAREPSQNQKVIK